MTEPDTPQERARSIFEQLRASTTEPAPTEDSGAAEPTADTVDHGPQSNPDQTTTDQATPDELSGEQPSAEQPIAGAAGRPGPEEPETPETAPDWLPEADRSSREPGDGWLPETIGESAPGIDTPEHPGDSVPVTDDQPSVAGETDDLPPVAGAAARPGSAMASSATVDPSLAAGPAPAPAPGRIAVPPDLSVLTEALAEAGQDITPEAPPSVEVDEFGRPRHPASVAHSLPRCLAVANQKGGVGKTTTTVNLGASLAELGYRVLVIDLDPQGNATTGLGVNARNLDSSVYDVMLHDVPVEDVIEPTTIRNLFIVPATIDLAGAEIELVPVFSRELRLRRALEPVEADFDFILIDCPPSLGLLTVNALAAAGEVLVPIQCEYYALEGLGQLLRNVNLVQSNLNSKLEVSTIVLTMYDARTKLAEQVAEEVRSHFGARVCRNVVPRTVRLSEAPSFGQPVITFDSSSRGAIAYRELAKEVSGGAPQRVR